MNRSNLVVNWMHKSLSATKTMTDLLRKSWLGIMPRATAMARTMHSPAASGVSLMPVLSSYTWQRRNDDNDITQCNKNLGIQWFLIFSNVKRCILISPLTRNFSFKIPPTASVACLADHEFSAGCYLFTVSNPHLSPDLLPRTAIPAVVELLFSFCDFKLWLMSFNFKLNKVSVIMNQQAKYLGRRSICWKVICPDTQTQTQHIDCSNRTTKVSVKLTSQCCLSRYCAHVANVNLCYKSLQVTSRPLA